MMNYVLIVPARYASTRFPGKPLADIAGKSMIRRVWERCVLAVPEEKIFIATDDDRIVAHCKEYGIQTVMTRSDCLTGTDRVHDASLKIEADVYFNVQGDEPLISPDDIRAIMAAAEERSDVVLNAICDITDEEEFRNQSIPKVITAPDGRLLYMSRAPVPSNKQNEFVSAKKQVCIYAFPKAALDAYTAGGKKTPMEQIEDLEMLRFLEIGVDVFMIEVSKSSIAVDWPDDIKKVIPHLHD